MFFRIRGARFREFAIIFIPVWGLYGKKGTDNFSSAWSACGENIAGLRVERSSDRQIGTNLSEDIPLCFRCHALVLGRSAGHVEPNFFNRLRRCCLNWLNVKCGIETRWKKKRLENKLKMAETLIVH
jgi:hypothetical protein